MKSALLVVLAIAPLFADLEVSAPELQTTKMETMNDQSKWLTYVKECTASKTTKKFTNKDKFGRSVTFEWMATDILSSDLVAFKKAICEIACEVLSPIEVEFLKAHPEAVSQELFLTACAPLFENGYEAIDWDLTREKIESTIRQFYLIDLSTFGPAVINPLLDDVYFTLTVKDSETEKLLGFALFAVTPALPYGNVKLINIALIPEEKDNILEQLLMSSIFKILPRAQRLFLYTRPTNVRALETYCSWGFTHDLNPVQDPNHKVNLEYLTLLNYNADRSTLLQKRTESLVAK